MVVKLAHRNRTGMARNLQLPLSKTRHLTTHSTYTSIVDIQTFGFQPSNHATSELQVSNESGSTEGFESSAKAEVSFDTATNRPEKHYTPQY